MCFKKLRRGTKLKLGRCKMKLSSPTLCIFNRLKGPFEQLNIPKSSLLFSKRFYLIADCTTGNNDSTFPNM